MAYATRPPSLNLAAFYYFQGIHGTSWWPYFGTSFRLEHFSRRELHGGNSEDPTLVPNCPEILGDSDSCLSSMIFGRSLVYLVR